MEMEKPKITLEIDGTEKLEELMRTLYKQMAEMEETISEIHLVRFKVQARINQPAPSPSKRNDGGGAPGPRHPNPIPCPPKHRGEVRKVEQNEKINFIQKADEAIDHITGCILEIQGNAESVSKMAKALAELLQARAYAEHLTCQSEEQ